MWPADGTVVMRGKSAASAREVRVARHVKKLYTILAYLAFAEHAVA